MKQTNLDKPKQTNHTNQPSNTLNMQREQLFFDVQKKTEIEQVLSNPDTFIGSVEMVEEPMYVLSETSEDASEEGKSTNASNPSFAIVEKTIQYVPGLFKLFDEGIVNCRDHVVRMDGKIRDGVPDSLPVTFIEVSIDEHDGTITMTNDGNGMDVVIHPEHQVWVPELIFGHLRTSTNYNKDEKKIVGGKNGYGFKLVLIWSTFGSIETIDHIRGLKYYQEFRNNLGELCPPVITPVKKSSSTVKPRTQIVFRPDYARLHTPLTADMISLFHKRVFDITALTPHVKVKFNSVPCVRKGGTATFLQYIQLYQGVDKPVYEAADNGRWEYAVCLHSSFAQVSFVNGIHTFKGGRHVDYIMGQIVRKVTDYIEEKKKVRVSSNSIKEQLMLFLRCDIENPCFDSQTKSFMETPVAKFGSKCDVSDKFIEKVAKMGVMKTACALDEARLCTAAAKRTNGVKRRTIQGIPKLEDANWAGTAKSSQCVLILCEGDSAKSGVISGLGAEDRDTVGVYPLKGKLMNVRGENIATIGKNKEIADIIKILGLEDGQQYVSMEDVHRQLRYSKVVILTDQDLDGSHIKGLIVNLFQSQWPSLTWLPGFLGFMNTPILKATNKKNQVINFYNQGEYDEWKQQQSGSGSNWSIKYYKGLGTSTKPEFQQYMRDKKFVGFEHTGLSEDAIDMVFNKKRANDRKAWLENVYQRGSFADTRKSLIPYEEFVHRELIHFSKYDCDRSIPNLMDGLKTSLRKILFGVFKKNLTSDIKVAQLSGYISEHSCYHHGEESLNKAIVGMAQNFVGSNNIHLLTPSGQFGTRLFGGSDAASPRYIFTRLEPLTRQIFVKEDDAILTYLDDDGTLVEPAFYAPIIPMVLVNGTKGIGTGFSTDIPCYNPRDLIGYLKHKLNLTDPVCLRPYYRGFKGTIEPLVGEKHKYIVKGLYRYLGGDQFEITELPIGVWTEDYKVFLEELVEKGTLVKEFQKYGTDETVHFVITLFPGKWDESMNVSVAAFEKVFKLSCTLSTSNMNLFNAEDRLTKYATVEDIIEDFFVTRLQLYGKRKAHQMRELEAELVVVAAKVRFIGEHLSSSLDLRNRSEADIEVLLLERGYPKVFNTFDYLTHMRMNAVCLENVNRLQKELQNKQRELDLISATSPEQMWLSELDTLEHSLVQQAELEASAHTASPSEASQVKPKPKAKAKPKAKTPVK